MITEHFEVLIKQTLLLDMSMTSFSTGISGPVLLQLLNLVYGLEGSQIGNLVLFMNILIANKMG